MIRLLRRAQEGQILVLALALMFLSVPLVTSALTLAGSLSIDSRVKTNVLKRQYAGLGAQQFALHQLLLNPAETTTVINLNDTTSTITVDKLLTPPESGFPFTSAKGRLLASKTVAPTTTTASSTVTYTITVLNTKDAALSPEKIVDELPLGFSYVTGTSVMTVTSTISTANPSIVATVDDEVLTWSVPSGTVLPSGGSMSLVFDAMASPFAGVFCNEAYAEPGGFGYSSGPTAKLTVGSPTQIVCDGAVISVTKTVDPKVVFGEVGTEYTYTIEIVNQGAEVVNITEIRDISSAGFIYVPLSTSSTPSVLHPGEPDTDPSQNLIKWNFGSTGLELATSTTWLLEFKATSTLSMGDYPNEVQLEYGRPEWLTRALAEACIFSATPINIGTGGTVDCSIASNGDIDLNQGASIGGNVISLSGRLDLGQNGVVQGTIWTTGEVDLGQSSVVKGDVISGGDVIVGQDAVIEGDIWAQGEVVLRERSVVKGDVTSGGVTTLKANAVVEGNIWAAAGVVLNKDSETEGDVDSEGDVDLKTGATVGGNIISGGDVSLGPGAAVTGTIDSNTTSTPATPPVPPIEFVSTGPTAVITVFDFYKITVVVEGSSGGETMYVCDVWISSDVDIGDFLDGCGAGATVAATPTPTPTPGPSPTPTETPTAVPSPTPIPTPTPTPTPTPIPTPTPGPSPTPTPLPTADGFVWFVNAIDISLSATSTWQDIDLSPNIPVGATGAIVEIVNTGVSSDYSAVVRGKEDTRDYMSNAAYQEIESKTHRWQIVKVDANRLIQGYIENGEIDFKLLGYTLGPDDPSYFTTPPDIIPSTYAAWTTVSVSGQVAADADGVILLIDSTTSTDQAYGIREVGSSYSTTDRNVIRYGNSMYLVGIDASDQFEAYIESASVKIYLVGQTRGSVVYFTNDTAATYPTTGSWQELDADAHGVPAEANGLVLLVEMGTDAGDRRLSFRHGDSTDDWNGDIGSGTHFQAAVGINDANVWDEYMEHTSASVDIAAYTKPP